MLGSSKRHTQSTLLDPVTFLIPVMLESPSHKLLERYGRIAICGHGDDSFRTRSLLLGLNLNLLATVSLTEATKRKSFYDFDFMDVVSEPERWAFMKKIKTETG